MNNSTDNTNQDQGMPPVDAWRDLSNASVRMQNAIHRTAAEVGIHDDDDAPSRIAQCEDRETKIIYKDDEWIAVQPLHALVRGEDDYQLAAMLLTHRDNAVTVVQMVNCMPIAGMLERHLKSNGYREVCIPDPAEGYVKLPRLDLPDDMQEIRAASRIIDSPLKPVGDRHGWEAGTSDIYPTLLYGDVCVEDGWHPEPAKGGGVMLAIDDYREHSIVPPKACAGYVYVKGHMEEKVFPFAEDAAKWIEGGAGDTPDILKEMARESVAEGAVSEGWVVRPMFVRPDGSEAEFSSSSDRHKFYRGGLFAVIERYDTCASQLTDDCWILTLYRNNAANTEIFRDPREAEIFADDLVEGFWEIEREEAEKKAAAGAVN